MSNFKWMPILRTGDFTDKNGTQVSIDKAKLDQVIANTDLAKEPQFVIDHPGFDEVGFGTIEKLKRVGEYLFALPKEVNEKFKSAVNSGKLPSRSVTLDKNNFALNNISFLNTKVKPAVSGLGDYSFSDVERNSFRSLNFSIPGIESHFANLEENNFEFAKYEVSSYPFRIIKDMFSNIREFIINKFDIETADRITPKFLIDEIGTPPSILESEKSITNFTEFSQNQKDNNMSVFDKTKLDAIALVEFERIERELTAARTDLNSKNVELQSANTKLTAVETEKLRTEVLQFCEENKLKIKPADKEKVVAFLMSLKEKGVIEFSQDPTKADAPKITVAAIEFAKELIKSSPDVIELGEMATNANASNVQEPEYVKTGRAIAACVK